MKTTRSYDMTTRARAAEQTRQRILEATFALQSERLAVEIGLEQVAERAQVSVQTVLRHFGSRDGLFTETLAWANQQVATERATPEGDVPGALEVLVRHYEQQGDQALMMLAQESTYPHVAQITASGKQLHRDWVAGVFAPWLGAEGEERDALLDLLVVATDVYTWKLLRRDRGLSRPQTTARMHRLVDAVLAFGTTPHRKDS